MVDQVIRTVLEADASKAVAGFAAGEKAVVGYERALTSAQRAESGRNRTSVFDDVPASADKAQGALTRLSGSVRDYRAAWDDLSTKAVVGGAALAIGIGSATKAAIGWESAWAGVKKTTDGTPEQMAALEGELRELARTLPATHEEIAGVAEAAGQLGVARKDIAGFTETAIALGESTNLSAEEAATGLAKISNVMGTMDREGVKGVERMGSALVALGNDGASTEADILAMAQRLSGAGKMIGATESDILAMSSALSSVGIEAELGGGAMSRALQKMNSAVIGGGKELEGFAEVAGMSAKEFADAWRDDPVAAANAFVSGLGGISESGGDAAATLDDLGLGGTQNAQVLLRAAGASDLLTDSLKLGADAYRDNNALMKEAEQRYATTESRLQVAKNTMKDAAIDAGSVLGPALASVAEKAAGVANAFVGLPKPVQAATTGVAGFTASALLLGGATVKVIGWGQDLSDTLGKLDVKFGGAEGSSRGFGRGIAYATAMMVALGAAGKVVDEATGNIEAGSQQAANMLLDLAENGKEAESATGVMARRWGDLATTVEYTTQRGGAWDRTKEFFADFGTLWLSPTVWDESVTAMKNIDAGLTELVNTGREAEALDIYKGLVAKTDGSEESLSRLNDALPSYTAAAEAAKGASDGTGQAIDGMGDDMAQAEQAAEDLTKAIKGLGDATLGQRAGAREYQQGLDDVAAALKENGRTLDISTKAGRANEAALDDLANTTQDWAASVFESTQDVDKAQDILDRGKANWLKYADAMGMSKPKAKELADELFKIDDLDAKADVDVETEKATKKTKDFQALITGMDGKGPTVPVKEDGATAARDKVLDFGNSLLGLKPRTVGVTESGAVPAKARVMAFNESIIDLSGKQVLVTEARSAMTAQGRVDNLRTSIANLDGKWVTVTEVGSTPAGNRVVQFKNRIYEVPPERSVTINANTAAALMAIAGVQAAMNAIQPKTVDITTRHRTERLNADGALYGPGLTQEFANGGFAAIGSQQPQIRAAGGMGITWAEDGAGPWEAFISGHPAKKPRSRAIAAQTVDRLGGQIVWDAEKGLQEAFANGGVYSRWQSQLRHVSRMANQRKYRWEDGSRMIDVFEDGTARWRGWGTAPRAVQAAINALNAAQDRYEAEKNRQERQRRAPKPKGQHSQEWYDTRARRAANRKAAEQKKAKAGGHATSGMARSGSLDPKAWYPGMAFKRSPSPHEGRTYVAPRRRSSSSGSSFGGGTVIARLDRRDAALIQKVAERPIRLEVNGRNLGATITRTAADRKGR